MTSLKFDRADEAGLAARGDLVDQAVADVAARLLVVSEGAMGKAF